MRGTQGGGRGRCGAEQGSSGEASSCSPVGFVPVESRGQTQVGTENARKCEQENQQGGPTCAECERGLLQRLGWPGGPVHARRVG